MSQYALGVDVGTGSARAAVFDLQGKCLGTSSQEIKTWRPKADFVQQSSTDIWKAVCAAVRRLVIQAEIKSQDVVGIGFDATCSLVVADADFKPVSIDPDGALEQDVVVWMDHRAAKDADDINQIGGDPLRYVGGRISPEMQLPKLRWLAREMPDRFAEANHFFDLPDWLVFRACGSLKRSLCSAVCKWTYLGHKGLEGDGWDDGFLEAVGLKELTGSSHERIGEEFLVPGEFAGNLSETAASELGLARGLPVASSLIDAHAGALGTLGSNGQGVEGRLAVIAGTSICHIALTDTPQFVPGVWGPYFGAVLPEMWCAEGGQSAAGALVDAIVQRHGAASEAKHLAEQKDCSIWSILDDRLNELAGDGDTAMLTRHRHINGDVLGNRSPLAEPWRLGGIDGLSTATGLDDLALDYLAAVQAIGYGTRHIINQMGASGVDITSLVFSGGLARSDLFVREVADITGLPVLLPEVEEPVLLGAAMLGARASGQFSSIDEVLEAMSPSAVTAQPRHGVFSDYHNRKFRVFRAMQQAHAQWRAIMDENE